MKNLPRRQAGLRKAILFARLLKTKLRARFLACITIQKNNLCKSVEG
jgi:hypothetical protein